MTSDEGMMCAARVMRDAAETNHRAADRIEEAVRQVQMLFDSGYGGTAPRLLEELEKSNALPPPQPAPVPAFTLEAFIEALENRAPWFGKSGTIEAVTAAYRELTGEKEGE